MLNPRTGLASETLYRLSGTARFKPTGTGAWWDLGDVIAHRPAADVRRKQILRASQYGLRLAHEDVQAALFVWTVDLQEHVAETLQTQFFAIPQDDVEQVSVSAEQISFTAVVKGLWYNVGSVDISNVVVTVGSDTFLADRDYIIDEFTGDVSFLQHGLITAGSTVLVTYDAAPRRYNRFTAASQAISLTLNGTLKIVEFDGSEGSRSPKAIISFPCTLSPDKWGDRSIDAFTGFTLRAAQLGEADYQVRSLPEPSFVAAGETLGWGSPLILLGSLELGPGSELLVA
jgi:hypothetical protein